MDQLSLTEIIAGVMRTQTSDGRCVMILSEKDIVSADRSVDGSIRRIAAHYNDEYFCDERAVDFEECEQ